MIVGWDSTLMEVAGCSISIALLFSVFLFSEEGLIGSAVSSSFASASASASNTSFFLWFVADFVSCLEEASGEASSFYMGNGREVSKSVDEEWGMRGIERQSGRRDRAERRDKQREVREACIREEEKKRRRRKGISYSCEMRRNEKQKKKEEKKTNLQSFSDDLFLRLLSGLLCYLVLK